MPRSQDPRPRTQDGAPSPVLPPRGALPSPLGCLVPALLALQVLDRREDLGGLAGAHVRLIAKPRQPVVAAVPGVLGPRFLSLLLRRGWLAPVLLTILIGSASAPRLIGWVFVARAVAARARWPSLHPPLLLLLFPQRQLQIELGVLVTGLGAQHL